MEKMDCYQGLKLTHILFFGGLGLMVLGFMIGSVGEHPAVMTALAAAGFAGVVAGLICGWTFVKCPDCGGSLLPGGRVTDKLPKFCPHCGKQL